MAKSVRFARRKRSSFKKRRAQIGKKSKVARVRRSRRRVKVMRGGAAWITGDRSNLSYVWNSLFYERAKPKITQLIKLRTGIKFKNSKYFNETKFSEFTTAGHKVLFVIDMQKDFIDREYKRTTDEFHPVSGKSYLGGNFDVADGKTMLPYPHDDDAKQILENITSISDKDRENVLNNFDKNSPFLNHIYHALNDDDSPYKHVIFTRDYHPVGHSSFSSAFDKAPLLCGNCSDLTGNFPAHCVQGFEGSRFVPEIEFLIKTAKYSGRIKILFKGMDMEYDSFTAVPKGLIDKKASNPKHDTCTSCSDFTGAYELTDMEVNDACDYNIKVTQNNNNTFDGFTKMDYAKLLNDTTHLEVCGLAGDYCVRDTVLALKQMFPNKTTVLLNDFTRYAALPFNSINKLAQHKSEIELGNTSYNPMAVLPGITDPTLNDYLEYAKSRNPNKDIVYYLLKFANGVRTLMEESELDSVSITKDTEEKDMVPLDIHHFITPMSSIIEDYEKNNIVVVMDEYSDKPLSGKILKSLKSIFSNFVPKLKTS